MSDQFRYMGVDDEDLRDLPAWAQYELAVRSMKQASQDPEKTMLAQLTMRDLSIASFGLILAARLFPETTGECVRLSRKLAEVGEAQNFITRGDDD